MKILVILPLYGGSLSIGRFVAQAFSELGHLVECFEAPSFYSAYQAFKSLRLSGKKLEQLENNYGNLVSQAVLAKVEDSQPDIVFSMAQAPLNRIALRKLKRDNVTTVMYFVEDYNIFKYWRAFAPEYDYFFTIQKNEFLEQLKGVGANGHYLPLAALPDFHKPTVLEAADKRKYGSDLSFFGAGYPNRRIAFRQLTHFDFKIWGSDWDGETLLAKNLQEAGRRISSEESIKIFNASKINLNLHSSVKSGVFIGQGDFVNPRLFELASCAAFQLTDERSLLPELFSSDEIISFATMQELHEKINYYLQHPALRQEIADRARARVLKEHTYQIRMQQALNIICENEPEKIQSKITALRDFTELPDGMRELLVKLNLSEHAEFNDIISELRKQSGVLSSLETSLLFLDEWRKQYSKV